MIASCALLHEIRAKEPSGSDYASRFEGMSYAQSEGEKQMTERAIKTESVTVIITVSRLLSYLFCGVFLGERGIYLSSWWFLLFPWGTAITQCLELRLVRVSYDYNGS